jgi:hypothetical protein
MFLSGKKVSYIGGTLSRMTGSNTMSRRKAMLKAAFKFGVKMQDGCKIWK